MALIGGAQICQIDEFWHPPLIRHFDQDGVFPLCVYLLLCFSPCPDAKVVRHDRKCPCCTNIQASACHSYPPAQKSVPSQPRSAIWAL